VVGGKCPLGLRFYRVAAKVPVADEELEGVPPVGESHCWGDMFCLYRPSR
jgi:hypothetical protein